MTSPTATQSEEAKWDCAIGTPEEDHYWEFHGGDSSVGEADAWICRFCGKVDESDREAPSYDDDY